MATDPQPHEKPAKYEPFVWPAGEKLQLAPRTQSLLLDLAVLLEQRQTRRVFKHPLDDRALGEFLWLACRNRSSRPSPFGPDQESRVYPSAGAMHPIHVLVSREAGPWLRFVPTEHALVELPRSFCSAAAVRDLANSLVRVDQGVVIGLLAESGKTAAKYTNHESLVWRDAGVVIGYMSLIAEALGLSFCPLGITGQSQFTDFLPGDTSTLQAVGIAVLGSE